MEKRKNLEQQQKGIDFSLYKHLYTKSLTLTHSVCDIVH